MTPLAQKIPAMSDADLKSLRINAERLLVQGSAVQVTTAQEILPLIDAQLAANAAAPKPIAPPKPRKPRRPAPVTGHQTALPPRAAA